MEILGPLVLGGFLMGIAAVLWGAWSLARSSSRLARPAWRRVAERVDGAIVQPGGGTLRLEARVAGALVEVIAHRCGGALDPEPSRTTVRTRLACRTPFRLRVRPRSRPLERAGGLSLWSAGDPTFDRAFVVLTSNEDLAGLWLTGRVRRAIVRARGYELRLEDGVVEARRRFFDDDGRALEGAMWAVAQVAAREHALLARLRLLARALAGEVSSAGEGFEPDGSTAVYLMARGMPARIDAVQRRVAGRPQVVTRVAVAAAQPLRERFHRAAVEDPDAESFCRRARLLATAEELGQMSLDPEVRGHIDELAPEWIAWGERQIAVGLGGLESRPDRLRQALTVASSLAAPDPAGPYR